MVDEVELLDRAPSVVFCPHPLMPARDRRMIFEPPRAGERLDAYLERVIGDLPDPCMVTIGDCTVPRAWWGRVTVKPGAVIGVAAAVAGGDGGSDVGRIVLTIAVVVAAVYTGGLAAGAMGWAGTGAMTLGQTAAYVAASAAVMTVGMMAVNALLPLPTNDLSGLGGSQASPTYSLAGGSNRVRRYEPLPLVIGTHRMFPDQACAGYTLFVNGNDQYLFIAFNFGFGDLEITDLRIGDTPLSDYKDLTVQWATGSMPSLIAGNVDTQGGTVLTATDGSIVRTTSVDTTEIHIDVQYVMFHAGNGGLEQYSATVKFEWRPVGSGSWLPFTSADGTAAWFGTTENSPFLAFDSTDGTAVLGSANRDVWRRTLRKTVAKGQYEVRITKLTPDTSDARTTCEISVPAIRSLQPDQGDYAGQRILGLKIRASGQLNGTVNQLSGLVSHRLNGVATSNPAKWFKAFALGAFIGGRRIWGAGLAAGRIDLAALDAWAAWCDTKGLSCNMVLDQGLSASTVLDRIARCGRGSKTWAPGLLSAVWDAAGLPAVAMFSPVNIRKGTFNISYPSEEMADELEVSYINPDNAWQRDTVRVPPNATNVRRTASVELLGCTSTALAGKEANLMYAQNLYRFRSISWETDAEGLTVRKGDVVTLSHDLTSWGEAGRLVAVASATQLTLDRAITLKPTGCWMAVCRPSGEITYHRVQVGATEAQAEEVTLLDPLPTTPAADGSPAVDWRYLADAKATPGWRVKITDVSPLPGMDGVRITAQDDPAEYYAAEGGDFSHVATLAASNNPVLSGLQVSEELIRAGAGYAVQLNLTWSAQGDVVTTRVRYKIDSGPWQEAGFAAGTRHSILVPETGSAYVEVTGFNGMGQSNLRSRLAGSYAIRGQDVPPPTAAGFEVTTSPDGTRVFTWSVAVVPPDVTYLEIRHAASTGTAWEAMSPLGRVPYGAGRAESIAPAAGNWTFEARMLDASGNYSATGARVSVTLGAAPTAGSAGGGNLLPSTDWSSGNFAPIVMGWNPGERAPLGLRVDDAWRPAGGQALELSKLGRHGNQYNIGADVYLTGGYGSRAYGIPVIAGERYELSGKLASHRCDSMLVIDFFDADNAHLSGAGTGWITRSSGGRALSQWTHAAAFATAPAGAAYASVFWRCSDTDVGEASSYAWLTEPVFKVAALGQTAPSPYVPGSSFALSLAIARANLAEVQAKAYADGLVDAEEARAIEDATTKANAAAQTALWTGVSGAGKPIDNAGRVIDLGDGGGAGQRQANDGPGWYPVGTLQQFKWSSSVGLGFGEWGVLRTERAWPDDSAAVIQTWKSSQGEWKRTGWVASGWGGWTRRIDRVIDANNVTQFVDPAAIKTDQLNSTAATENWVFFDAAGWGVGNVG